MDESIYNNEERINRYLHGEMTQEEETIFEADLQNDDTLKRQAEAMARMVKGLSSIGNEQDRLLVENMRVSSDKKDSATTTVKVAAGKPVIPFKWISLAAGFALVLTVGHHVYDYTSTTRLGREYATAFPMSDVIRGEENEDVANTLTILFDNVTNGKDLDHTIAQLKDLWQLSQSNTYNEYTTYEPYIGWYLAMAHLRNYDKKEAKAILIQLKLMYPVGTTIGDSISDLLNKI